jgi:hypothetical protein
MELRFTNSHTSTHTHVHAPAIAPALPLYLSLSLAFAPTSPLPFTRTSSRSTAFTFLHHFVPASPLTSLHRPVRSAAYTLSRAFIPSPTLATARSPIRPAVSSGALPSPLSSCCTYAVALSLSASLQLDGSYNVPRLRSLLRACFRSCARPSLLPILRSGLTRYFTPHPLTNSLPSVSTPTRARVRPYCGKAPPTVRSASALSQPPSSVRAFVDSSLRYGVLDDARPNSTCHAPPLRCAGAPTLKHSSLHVQSHSGGKHHGQTQPLPPLPQAPRMTTLTNSLPAAPQLSRAASPAQPCAPRAALARSTQSTPIRTSGRPSHRTDASSREPYRGHAVPR